MRVVLICIALLGLPRSVEAAQPPTALVESVTGAIVGTEYLDDVSPGQVIQLGSSGMIILAYLDSCTRETITGGEVTVGMQASQVKGGEIRSNSRHEAMRQFSTNSDYGGSVFRSRPTAKRSADARRALIYSLSPVSNQRSRHHGP